MIGLQSGRPNWEGLKSFPSPGSMTGKVYGASAVSFGTSFMIFGGYSWPEIYSSIYEFFENKWSNKGEMLLPRHGHRSVLTKSGDSWVCYCMFDKILTSSFRLCITLAVHTKDLIKIDRALLHTRFFHRMEHNLSVPAL